MFQMHPGLTDRPAGIRRQGRDSTFSVRGRPVDLCLIPLATGLVPQCGGLLAVEALRAQRKQFAGSLDRLQRALVQGGHVQAGLAGPLVQTALALVHVLLALTGLALALIRPTLALIRPALALIRPTLALIRHGLTAVGLAFPRVSLVFPLVSRALTGSLSALGGCGVRPLTPLLVLHHPMIYPASGARIPHPPATA